MLRDTPHVIDGYVGVFERRSTRNHKAFYVSIVTVNVYCRYTANDACFPHCELIYKDHYHCMESDCSVLFRSKEGVRDHAKYD